MTPRDTLAPWDAEIGTVKVFSGPGRLAALPELVRELDAGRVLLVTDPGLEAAGHAERALAALRDVIETWVFDGVEENPTAANVRSGTAFAREHDIDRQGVIVALGGGSAMDCAKGINFVLTNGGSIQDYWGYGKAARPLLPMIGVPSTAGTGSDAQSYALIIDDESRRKMACGDVKARFHSVILDPEVASTAPRRVAANAGVDAVSHAVESFVCTRANPVSRMLSRRAWEYLEGNLATALAGEADLDVVAGLQFGAHLAGAAIESSMLGAAHAAANPLTSRYRIVHGEAVGLLLPHVVRFNAAMAAGDGDIYHALEPAGAEVLAAKLEDLRQRAGMPEQLRQRGVEKDAIADLAERATREWTGTFNPRPVGADDFVKIYEAAF